LRSRLPDVEILQIVVDGQMRFGARVVTSIGCALDERSARMRADHVQIVLRTNPSAPASNARTSASSPELVSKRHGVVQRGVEGSADHARAIDVGRHARRSRWVARSRRDTRGAVAKPALPSASAARRGSSTAIDPAQIANRRRTDEPRTRAMTCARSYGLPTYHRG
jgi:hypothetical protein